MAVTTERAQDGRVPLSRLRVHVDHDATLISPVDAHLDVADTKDRADPCVLGERRVVDRLDNEIGTEPQRVERRPSANEIDRKVEDPRADERHRRSEEFRVGVVTFGDEIAGADIEKKSAE